MPQDRLANAMGDSRYRIIKTEVMAKGWSSLQKLTVAARLLNGNDVVLHREVADHGHGAAILPFDPQRGTCLLVRQWRAGAAFNGDDGFLLEVCAGLLDADHPEECVRREAMEELGTNVHSISHVSDCYPSPGAVSERVSLFTGHYGLHDRLHNGGGLHTEHEDIAVIEMPFAEAFAMIAQGGIKDAKTIILLQHVKLQMLNA